MTLISALECWPCSGERGVLSSLPVLSLHSLYHNYNYDHIAMANNITQAASERSLVCHSLVNGPQLASYY